MYTDKADTIHKGHSWLSPSCRRANKQLENAQTGSGLYRTFASYSLRKENEDFHYSV